MSGYDFVPLPPTVHRSKRRAMTFDRRLEGHLFGTVTLTYQLDQPVHVGSGYKGLDDGKLVRTAARSGGSLVVPGSSMKGAIRSRFEAISRSCSLGPPLKNGRQRPVISQSHPHVKNAEMTPTALGHDAFRTGRGGCAHESLCPACALFGFQSGRDSARGRVSFGDFAAEPTVQAGRAQISPQFSPRLHHLGAFEVRGETFIVRTVHGRKFYAGRGPEAPGARQTVETIPAGTVVRGAVTLFNATLAEMGGLLCALGFDPPSLVKVGAGKALGLGRMRPHAITFALRDARRGTVPHDPPSWRTAFMSSPDCWGEGLEKLLAIHTRGDV